MEYFNESDLYKVVDIIGGFNNETKKYKNQDKLI